MPYADPKYTIRAIRVHAGSIAEPRLISERAARAALREGFSAVSPKGKEVFFNKELLENLESILPAQDVKTRLEHLIYAVQAIVYPDDITPQGDFERDFGARLTGKRVKVVLDGGKIASFYSFTPLAAVKNGGFARTLGKTPLKPLENALKIAPSHLDAQSTTPTETPLKTAKIEGSCEIGRAGSPLPAEKCPN